MQIGDVTSSTELPPLNLHARAIWLPKVLRASNKTPITINITGTVPYQPWGGAGAYTAPRETRYSGKFMRRSKS